MTRRSLVTLFALAASLCGPLHARADVTNASATNVQEGDNDNETTQRGSADSGDAVAGQVIGVVSSGDASVDATNRTDHSSARSGDVDGTNSMHSFVGPNGGGSGGANATDIINGSASSVQEGDNRLENTQSASVSSGDAVAGQVSGVVTAASGRADLVLANTTTHSDARSGDGDVTQFLLSTVSGGLAANGAAGLPALVISDASSGEPGTLSFHISVQQTVPQGTAGRRPTTADSGISVTVTSKDGSAMAEGQPGDYQPTTTTVNVPAGGDGVTVNVTVNDDQTCESVEHMKMILSNPHGATIADGTGVGSIDEGKDC